MSAIEYLVMLEFPPSKVESLLIASRQLGFSRAACEVHLALAKQCAELRERVAALESKA